MILGTVLLLELLVVIVRTRLLNSTAAIVTALVAIVVTLALVPRHRELVVVLHRDVEG